MGRIELVKFLYNRKVPGILPAQCRCRAGEETPQRMALYCIEEIECRQLLRTNRRVNFQRPSRDKRRRKKNSRVGDPFWKTRTVLAG